MKRSISAIVILISLLSLPSIAATILTKALYTSIKTGMTRAQVVKLIGREPSTSSESEIMNIKSEMDSWTNEWTMDGITVIFQNGKVSSKTQMGLK